MFETIFDNIWAFIFSPLWLPSTVIAYIIWYIVSYLYQRYFPQTALTPEEEECIIQAWNPEPLVPKCDKDHYALNPRIVSSYYGKNIIIDGKKCLNFATHNYLGFAEDPDCINEAINAVKTYGVGSCGPRGFFGTVDIHLELEEEIAKFMGTEEAILYSYGYAAISSAIPAYSKVTDVIFVDEAVNFAIQQGLIASRSKIKFFSHNDMEHLEQLLDEQREWDLKNPKLAKKTSRFMVVEGLYINTGDLCPLPKIIELKRKHKVRLFIDDTCAFGVLGQNGRGIVEHYGCSLNDIDMIAASLESACASYGGFCTGTRFVIDHQRLSGMGYCFSASLPPLQAAYALRAIKKIENNPDMIKSLNENCKFMHKLLAEQSRLISVSGDEISPIKHIRFATSIEEALKSRNKNQPPKSDLKDKTKKLTPHEYDTLRLEKVVDHAFKNNLALTVARYLERCEHKLPKPSIRLIVTSIVNDEEMQQACSILVESFETVQNSFARGEF